MKFLVDAQLPRHLSHWLKQRGHDSLHTLDLRDSNRTSDLEVMRVADTEERIVITKDEDYYVPGSISILCVHGWVMSVSTPRTSTLKSTWRPKLRLWQNVRSLATTRRISHGLTILH